MPESIYIYYITHSFVTAGFIYVLLYFTRKKLLFLAFPVALHVLFDIPFHCGLFATRFLYPFSNFHICGYSYTTFSHAWLWPLNYLVIGIVYYYLRKKEKEKNRRQFMQDN